MSKFFYQLNFTIADGRDRRCRKVLVYQETSMNDLYSIAVAAMELHDSNHILNDDEVQELNHKLFKGKKIEDVLTDAHNSIIIILPIINIKKPGIENIEIKVLLEKKLEVDSMDLCPQCIYVEDNTDRRPDSILTKINSELKGWNLNYYEILCSQKTKKEMQEFAKFLNISIPSNLNKEEYAIGLETVIFKHPEIIKRILSQRDMELLCNLISSAPDEEGFDIDNIIELSKNGFANLSFEIGNPKPFSIPNNVSFLLYDHLLKMSREKEFKQEYLLENNLLGLITLYGVLKVNDAIDLLKRYSDVKYDEQSFINFLFKSLRLYNRIKLIRYGKNVYICSLLVNSHQYIIDLIESRADIKHKIFNEEEVKEATKLYYYYQGEPSHFIENAFNSPSTPGQTEIAMHYLWMGIQNESDFQELIEIVNKTVIFDSIEDYKNIIGAITEYSNNVPKWILKGNSSNEVYKKEFGHMPFPGTSQMQMFREKESEKFNYPVISSKTGRNDPCPCGSGKKYKHCCGNN